MDLVPVISSSLAAVGYDPTAGALTVKFSRGGRVYTYLDVPQAVYTDFLAAPSKGRFFLANVKNQYEF